MHMCHFCIRLQLQNCIGGVFERNNKPNVPLPSMLIHCQSFSPQLNYHIQKTVGDKVTTSRIGKKWHQQYSKDSAKERVDISDYSTEALRLPYRLFQFCNARTLTHSKLRAANSSMHKKYFS